MNRPYDIVQTAFLLSGTANGAASIAATQAQLQGYLNAYLNGGTDPIGTKFPGFFPQMNAVLAGGDWKVLWGPAVYSVKPQEACEAANAMYVAYSAALKTYIVAVAATNPSSLYDWIDEDGDVLAFYQAEWPLVTPFVRTWHLPWIFDVPAGISAATALGVSNLLTQPAMVDPATGATLQAFLAGQAKSDHTLIFTGHSLAGALAPTLALYLYPEPSSSGWEAVRVLPTAGASPGNGKFAALFAAAYPAVSSGVDAPYGNWNIDYANVHDVVPHAWNQLDGVVGPPDGAGNYPSFFGVLDPQIGRDLTLAVKAAKDLALGGHYANLTQQAFTPDWGVFTWTQQNGVWQYPPVWTELPVFTDAAPLSKIAVLGQLIAAAHVDQYFNFFGVLPPPRMTTKPASPAVGADLRKRALLAAARVSHPNPTQP